MRSENTWQEIRDHSFIQNHSRPFRFTDPWRCFFSSVHSSSTGFRSENTWQEIRDHSFIQNHSRPYRFTDPWRCFFSSVHRIHLLQGSGQRTGSLVLGSVSHFCVVFEVFIWVFEQSEDQNMAHCKISNRVSHLLIFYLLYLIESMMPCI